MSTNAKTTLTKCQIWLALESSSLHQMTFVLYYFMVMSSLTRLPTEPSLSQPYNLFKDPKDLNEMEGLPLTSLISSEPTF